MIGFWGRTYKKIVNYRYLILLTILIIGYLITKNNFSLISMRFNEPKLVIFDMDETLGYFVEFGIFVDCLERTHGKKLSDQEFVSLLDMYPEFLRPNILNILKYLSNKKRRGECYKIFIYTNNQGPKSWANKIKMYFETKLNSPIFDQVIGAYKINGRVVEINRRSHDKTVDDFIRCTGMPQNSKMCFLDDQYHPRMEHPNVYYINLKPYEYQLHYDDMINRYIQNYLHIIPDKSLFYNKMINYLRQYSFKTQEKKDLEHEIDNIVGKKVHSHLEDFFKINKQGFTRRRSTRSKSNGSRKI